MSYQTLYRVYRPKVFSQIKGQNHIVTTLKNIVATQKVSHAYLFSGPRGIGKTSTAKVFATALNCTNLAKNFDACTNCVICKEIIAEKTLDIIEIDAASNNGVADIRKLRDNAIYPPTNTQYKIYIIDEVHMLSKGAFNALLKILEEPPKQIIFILATTEAYKIPITVLSRTQHFNFRRANHKLIGSYLETIAIKENLKYDFKALRLISNLSDGSLRDALTIIEQVGVYNHNNITFQAIIDVFGIVGNETLIKFINLITSKSFKELLSLVNEFVNQSIDFSRTTLNLINLIKDFIVFSKTNHIELLEILSKDEITKLNLDISLAYKMLDVFVELLSQLKRTEHVQQTFELAILKLTNDEIIPTKIDHNLVASNKNVVEVKENIQPKKDKKIFESKAEVIKENPQKKKQILEQKEVSLEVKKDPKFTQVNDETFLVENAKLEDVFGSQETKTKVVNSNKFDDPTIISDDEITKTTEIITLDKEKLTQAEEIDEAITSTQEVEFNPKPRINKPTEPEDDKKEDLLSLFISEEDSKAPIYSIETIINLLIQADKIKHQEIKQKWLSLTIWGSNQDFANYISILDSSKLISSGDKFILLVCESEQTATLINQVKNETKFIELIFKLFGKVLNVFAITKANFERIKQRYKELALVNELPKPKTIEVPKMVQTISEAKQIGKEIFGDDLEIKE